MSLEYIIDKDAKLVKKSGTRNPFRIAKDIGIKVMFVNDFEKLKGVYRVIKRNRWIFINSNLSERMQRIVCAHELGHDQLHRNLANGNGMMEFVLYDTESRPEFEANVLASQVLLSDDDVLELIHDGYDVEQISRILDSDINLVALKVSLLNQQGYTFRTINYKSNFLK